MMKAYNFWADIASLLHFLYFNHDLSILGVNKKAHRLYTYAPH